MTYRISYASQSSASSGLGGLPVKVLNAAPAAYTTIQPARTLSGSSGQPLCTPNYQPATPVRNIFHAGNYNQVGPLPPAAATPPNYVVQRRSLGFSQLTPVKTALSPRAVTTQMPAVGPARNLTFQAAAPAKPQEVGKVAIGAAVRPSTPVSSVSYRLLRAQLQPGALREIIGLMNAEMLKETLLKSEGLSDFDIFLQSDGELVAYCRFDSETALQASGARVEHALQLMEKHLVGATHRLSAKGGIVTPAGLKVWSLRGKSHVVQHRMEHTAIKPGYVESLKLRACRPEMEQACKKILGLQAVEIVAVSDEALITKCSYESMECLQASEAKAKEVLAFLSEYATCSPKCFSARGGTVDIKGEKLWSFSTASNLILSPPCNMDVDRPMVVAKPVANSSESTMEKPLGDPQEMVPPVAIKKRSGGDCFSWFTQGPAKRRIREQDTASPDVVMGA